jgi:hypothetical protein
MHAPHGFHCASPQKLIEMKCVSLCRCGQKSANNNAAPQCKKSCALSTAVLCSSGKFYPEHIIAVCQVLVALAPLHKVGYAEASILALLEALRSNIVTGDVVRAACDTLQELARSNVASIVVLADEGIYKWDLSQSQFFTLAQASSTIRIISTQPLRVAMTRAAIPAPLTTYTHCQRHRYYFA